MAEQKGEDGKPTIVCRSSAAGSSSAAAGAATLVFAVSAGKQANKMIGSVNMSKSGHVALVHVEETAVEETEEPE